MGNLTELNQFDTTVYQLETNDPVQGGPGGKSNVQAQALANRTKYLNTQLTAHVGSSGTAHGVATSSSAGFMSSSDKSKLDNVALGAAAVGSVTPLTNGTAAAGTATTAARSDHVHPIDTSRAPLASPSFTGNPTAPMLAVTDVSNGIATTGWVAAALSQLATASGFIFGAGSNGFLKLPSWLGSLIIQWGDVPIQLNTNSYANVGTSQTVMTSASVPFPVIFPSVCYTAIANGSEAQNGEGYMNVTNFNVTGFTAVWTQMLGTAFGEIVRCRFLAIGK